MNKTIKIVLTKDRIGGPTKDLDAFLDIASVSGNSVQSSGWVKKRSP
jgi:hypothetical protein